MTDVTPKEALLVTLQRAQEKAALQGHQNNFDVRLEIGQLGVIVRVAGARRNPADGGYAFTQHVDWYDLLHSQELDSLFDQKITQAIGGTRDVLNRMDS